MNPDLLSQCVHCGFCLQACPTYVLWGNEMDSPRGRIYLMDMLNQGETTMTPKFVQHMDACLGCVSCMTACPSGVNYGKLIEETRSQIEHQYKRPLRERLLRWAILHTFPNVALLRIGRMFLSAYQKLGLPSLNALMPKLGKREDVSGITAAQGAKRARVGLMLGCVQREFVPEINAATVRVLAAEGCEVVAPAEQPCCGALLMHAGKDEAALALTRRLFSTFEKAGVDIIITNAGGCGSHLKEFSVRFQRPSKRRRRIPGRARPPRRTPPRLEVRRLSRLLPSPARPKSPHPAPPIACRNPRPDRCRNARVRPLLRLRRNLQPGATRHRQRTRRPQSRSHPSHRAGRRSDRKRRLHPANASRARHANRATSRPSYTPFNCSTNPSGARASLVDSCQIATTIWAPWPTRKCSPRVFILTSRPPSINK